MILKTDHTESDTPKFTNTYKGIDMTPDQLAKLREQAGIVNEVFFYDADKGTKNPTTAKDIAIVMTGLISKSLGLNSQNIREKGQAVKAKHAANALMAKVQSELDKMISQQLG